MATLKNEDVKPALEAIVALRDERLPIDTSIQLRYLGRELEAQAAVIEAERTRIIAQYGGCDEHGRPDGRLTPQSEHWAAFLADYKELLGLTFEVQHTITRDMLTTRDANGQRIPLDPPASVIFGLGDLLEAPAATVTAINRPKRRARG